MTEDAFVVDAVAHGYDGAPENRSASSPTVPFK
jgi:hypothetical protein